MSTEKNDISKLKEEVRRIHETFFWYETHVKQENKAQAARERGILDEKLSSENPSIAELVKKRLELVHSPEKYSDYRERIYQLYTDLHAVHLGGDFDPDRPASPTKSKTDSKADSPRSPKVLFGKVLDFLSPRKKRSNSAPALTTGSESTEAASTESLKRESFR